MKRDLRPLVLAHELRDAADLALDWDTASLQLRGISAVHHPSLHAFTRVMDPNIAMSLRLSCSRDHWPLDGEQTLAIPRSSTASEV